MSRVIEGAGWTSACWALVICFAACHDRGSEAATGSSVDGSTSGATQAASSSGGRVTGSDGSTGTSVAAAGVGGSESQANGGAAGAPDGTAGAAGAGAESVPCPGIVEPTLVTELAGARTLDADGYEGGDTPQLDLDGPDPNFTYNDPHVLKVGAQYWMYASATDLFDFPVRIYRLVSNDGIQWRREPSAPVFEPDMEGTWDAGGVETPAVVYFRGRYHLFYTGYPVEVDAPGHDVADYRVGHAVSCDGVRFSRASEPILAPSGSSDADATNDWYAFIVGEPGPVVYHEQLFLYFTAVGANAALGTSLQVIGLTTSNDAEHWTEPRRVLEPDQTEYPRVVDPGPPLDGWVGYSTPSAVVLNGSMHLFVDVAYDPDEASWQQIRLHHAVSEDGVTDWQQDAAPLLSAGAFAWAVDEVRAPSALIDGDTLRLYFAGHELDGNPPDHFAIGMLSQPLR